MATIFFYGLFMDRSLLTGMGLHPDALGPAVLVDYRIHIGERATLLPSPSSRAYGVVMELTDEEARHLYSGPTVQAYVPEPVQVELLDKGTTLDASCYNLPRDVGLAGTNAEYAAKLSKLASALGFDPAYVEEIAAFGRTDTPE